jgi:hypothetical protein
LDINGTSSGPELDLVDARFAVVYIDTGNIVFRVAERGCAQQPRLAITIIPVIISVSSIIVTPVIITAINAAPIVIAAKIATTGIGIVQKYLTCAGIIFTTDKFFTTSAPVIPAIPSSPNG